MESSRLEEESRCMDFNVESMEESMALPRRLLAFHPSSCGCLRSAPPSALAPPPPPVREDAAFIVLSSCALSDKSILVSVAA